MVKDDGYAFKYASEDLQADRKVVLEAVKNDGFALEFASWELQADKEVVLEAVKNECRAFEYASEELRNDKEFILEVIPEIKDEIDEEFIDCLPYYLGDFVYDVVDIINMEDILESRKDGNALEWEDEVYDIVEFVDLYISKCQEADIDPDPEIIEEFKVYVEQEGYEPKYAEIEDRNEHTVSKDEQGVR